MTSKSASAPVHAAPGVSGSASSTSSGGFPSSTHARCWLFGGDEELHQTRVHAQKKARKRINKLNASNAANAAASAAASAANSASMSDVAAPVSPSSKPSTAANADAMIISTPPVKEKKASSDGAELQPLTLIEEQQLRLHYVTQLTQMAQLLNLPSYVRHASIIFFKRFYLRESVMEFSPKEVAYCCIFLATKSEEFHVPLEKIIAVIQNKTQSSTSPADAAASAVAAAAANATMVSTVLALEVAVLTQLQFQLRLYTFQRALKGLMLELVEFQSTSTARLIRIHTPRPADTASVQNPPTETIESFLTARATALYEHILLDDDLIFLYAPAQLALGALVLAERDIRSFAIDAPGMPLSEKDAAVSAAALKQLYFVERYVATKPVGGKAAHNSSSSTAVPSLPLPLQVLVDRLAALPPPSTDKKQLKSVEKRRKVLSNPLTDPTSAASQQEKMAREREKESKRDAKKKKQREENTKAETAFLMDDGGQGKAGGGGSSMFDDADDDEGFSIHKRMKSAQGTPIQLAKIPMND